MYGWLISPDDKQLLLELPQWRFDRPPQISPPLLPTRSEQTATVVQAAFPDNERLRASALAGCTAALQHVSDRYFDYALHVGVAFYRKHAEDHDAVQTTIDEIVDRELGAIGHDADQRFATVSHRLKAALCLVPAGLRASITNETGGLLRKAVMGDNMDSPSVSELKKAYAQFNPSLRKIKPATMTTTVTELLSDVLMSASAHELASVVLAVQTLFKLNRIDVFKQFDIQFKQAAPTLPQSYCFAALRNGILLTQQDPRLLGSEAAEHAFQVSRCKFDATWRTVLYETISAFDAGLDLGELSGPSRRALQRWRANKESHREERLGALVAFLQGKAQAPTLSSQMLSTDSSLARTCCIDQVVNWIGGPMYGARHQAFEPARVLDRARKRKAAPRPGVYEPDDVVPGPDEADEPDTVDEAEDFELNEGVIESIGHQGFAAAADFMLEDLRSLLPVGRDSKAPAGLLTACAALAAPLEQLAKASTGASADAQALLTQAEAAIDALRKGIKIVQAETQKQESFLRAFLQALARADIALGNRTGGVIGCALTLDDWGWVVEQYHGCWYAGLKQIVIGGAIVDLDADVAVAFYVTGSSRSGHLFCVTLHLWRRYADAAGPPGIEATSYSRPFPPMNEQDWFDTHESLTVLHVNGPKPRVGGGKGKPVKKQ